MRTLLPRTLVVGTRGSALAMAQTETVVQLLQAGRPDISIETRQITTGGDRDQHSSLAQIGGQGVFVKEIESALLRREIDLAVHSLKDMPSELPDGLTLAAVLLREDPRDALVSRDGLTLETLPPGARVGTGSLRRRAQLRAHRPDLEIVDLRGNVDTRLRKLHAGEYDAIVLALAGLKRLGRTEATQILPIDVMLPAVGQGVIALEARRDDRRVLSLLHFLHHPPTGLAVTAERAFLAELGVGCRLPVAAYATVEGEQVHLRALVADAEGNRLLKGELVGPTGVAQQLGIDLACQLLAQGAEELLPGGYAHV